MNSPVLQHRIYANTGNSPLIALLGAGCGRVLDVGCGAGDNAALIKAEYPETQVFGISCSAAEAEIALQHMGQCWVFDIESEFPSDMAKQSFDAMIFSHVLEHLREPAAVLARFTRLLNPMGKVLIAVPNVLSWRQRVKFFLGRLEYESAGVLDDTHLRFFTYLTADRYLLSQSPNLELASKSATGSVPLWWLRRHVLPKVLCNRIDAWGCRHWPNLFGGQVLIKAVKK
ncbi:MAG: hypothetical protein A2156_01725 [Deltaproteobacteria bacterium RBG_16_48_10]|nr:MAG: hypothetical protein A2156_01725 [Deltaproteobacteria bacterium RBG_16_48_10]